MTILYKEEAKSFIYRKRPLTEKSSYSLASIEHINFL